MRTFRALIGIVALALSAPASASPTVALLTMSPGEHPFERFGHTALRVDPGGNAEPLVFNYGTFDSRDPHLVGKFLRHELPYWLSVSTWRETQAQYARRRIVVQELALTPVEAERLYTALLDNATPERRAYRYEFFRDNCSTRVRDMIAAVAPELRTANEGRPGVATFRQAVWSVLAPVPFYRRAIDLVLNGRVDEPITRWDDAFLPRELESLARETRRADGKPLVAKEGVWIGPSFHEPGGAHPLAELVWLALLVPFAFVAVVRERGASSRVTVGIALVLWGLATGVVGTLLLVLSLTPYDVARGNGTVVALWPATLALVPFGVLLVANRLRTVSLQRLRALLVALLGPIVVDLVGHLIGVASQHHVVPLVYVAAGHLLALLALGAIPAADAQTLRAAPPGATLH